MVGGTMFYDVTVIGLGYVGLTLATALAASRRRVLGVEKRPDVVSLVNQGRAHFSEQGLDELLASVVSQDLLRAQVEIPRGTVCDTYFITVGTPLGPDGQVRLDFLETATRQVAAQMRDGALVILRSTVKIGTARSVVAPILASSGKKFQIAVCPERTLEGNAISEIRKLPQIVGADDDETRERAARFFYRMTHTVVQVSSLEAGEIVKLVDNTYRDVQFGFANEVARICDAWGVNATEVIEGGKLGYPRTNVAMPGLVGGPCLEKDPHILAQSCEQRNIQLDVTRAARAVNERQPRETVEFILGEHRRRHGGRAPTVALLGMAFKGRPETDDLRGAMSLKVLRELVNGAPDATIRLYDPVCSAASLREAAPGHVVAGDMIEAITNAHVVIIANNHPALGMLRPRLMAPHLVARGFIYDYWNHFSDLRPSELGEIYLSVGNSGGARRAGQGEQAVA
jgi:UDP-N-acetyl-D-mannosaminuronic acid dehydrogenase